MDVLKIIFVCLLGVMVCAGIIVFSCFYVARQADQLEELQHPEFIEMDGRK